jgi:serine protease Do
MVKLRSLALLTLLTVVGTVTAAADEREDRAWLGVYLGDSVERGVVILAVVARGPAQRGGLRAGDVLTSLGDVEILSPDDVAAFLDGAEPGREIRTGILREGKAESRTIELRARPEIWDPQPYRSARGAPADAWWRAADAGGRLGITLAEIPDDLRVHYGASPGRGSLVTRVAPQSEASRAGVAVGDVLVRAGRAYVGSPGDFAAALVLGLSDRALELELVRNGKPLVVELEVRATPAPDPGLLVPGPAERDGTEAEIRIRLLERELRRLEERLLEVREELERLRGGR